MIHNNPSNPSGNPSWPRRRYGRDGRDAEALSTRMAGDGDADGKKQTDMDYQSVISWWFNGDLMVVYW